MTKEKNMDEKLSSVDVIDLEVAKIKKFIEILDSYYQFGRYSQTIEIMIKDLKGFLTVLDIFETMKKEDKTGCQNIIQERLFWYISMSLRREGLGIYNIFDIKDLRNIIQEKIDYLSKANKALFEPNDEDEVDNLQEIDVNNLIDLKDNVDLLIKIRDELISEYHNKSVQSLKRLRDFEGWSQDDKEKFFKDFNMDIDVPDNRYIDSIDEVRQILWFRIEYAKHHLEFFTLMPKE